MARHHYYLLSALPALDELGSVPLLSPSQLYQHVAASPKATKLVEAVLLADDLVQREAYLAGEIQQVDPAVLSPAQARNESPLPETLQQEHPKPPSGLDVDVLWGGFFSHVAKVARAESSRFLSGWVGSEVALRNAVVTARAQALELDPSGYMVRPELADPNLDFSPVVNEWASAPDPLRAQRVLDEARWRWLIDHDGRFSFEADELAAYAAKLILIHRWHRLTEENKG